MRLSKAAWVLWIAAVATSCAPALQVRPPEQPHGATATDDARVVVDFSGVDAWLECVEETADVEACEEASVASVGGRIAALAHSTFGNETPPQVTPDRDAVAALVEQMKEWPDPLQRAARFLPAQVGGGAIRAFVVANGHPWGDAYVRGVRGEGEQTQLSDAGDHVIILNAVLIASAYRGNAAEQSESALGVLSHEVFHVLFRRYQQRDVNWTRLGDDLSPREALQILVLNEGVAHFVDRGPDLVGNGFPRERAANALAALSAVWTRLGQATEGSEEVVEILSSANQGSYWDKYGSISGMLLAYGVFRVTGENGIKESLRCGPGRLLSLYVAAEERITDLPSLPEGLESATWIDFCHPSSVTSSQLRVASRAR